MINLKKITTGCLCIWLIITGIAIYNVITTPPTELSYETLKEEINHLKNEVAENERITVMLMGELYYTSLIDEINQYKLSQTTSCQIITDRLMPIKIGCDSLVKSETDEGFYETLETIKTYNQENVFLIEKLNYIKFCFEELKNN